MRLLDACLSKAKAAVGLERERVARIGVHTMRMLSEVPTIRKIVLIECRIWSSTATIIESRVMRPVESLLVSRLGPTWRLIQKLATTASVAATSAAAERPTRHF